MPDRQGEIHVFLNSLQHRGMKVCATTRATLPYSPALPRLELRHRRRPVGVPFYKDAYHEELDKSQWGLIRVPRMVNYKGGIWATWDPNAPDFLEYIGGFRTYLDILFDGWDGTEGGTEIIGGIEKWMVPSNWKFPAENFIGDRYHNISHRSVTSLASARPGRVGATTANGRAPSRWTCPSPNGPRNRDVPAARGRPARAVLSE